MPTDASPRAAPLWRHFAAALYDGMLLVALWMTGVLAAGLMQDFLRIPGGAEWEHRLQIYLFSIGLLMFGWFWTHGGQTPGLKAWRLRLQRADGGPLRWPIAAIRYAAMLVCWTASLAPLLLFAARLRAAHPALEPAAWACLVVFIAATLVAQFDPLRRSPQDRIAGTRIVQAPAGSTSRRISTDPVQPPGGKQHE